MTFRSLHISNNRLVTRRTVHRGQKKALFLTIFSFADIPFMQSVNKSGSRKFSN